MIKNSAASDRALNYKFYKEGNTMQVLTVDYRSNDAARLFTQSLVDTGFAVLSNHSIDSNLVQATYGEWEAFFSSQEKFNYLFDKEKQDGYFPLDIAETAKGSSVKDIKEFFHIYPAGRYPSSLSNNTKLIYQALSNLAAELLQWIEKHTPTEIVQNFAMPLSQMIHDSERTLLRILHYPPLTGQEEEGSIRAAAHEDINLITLLVAGTAPGLQVKDARGNWHEVSCDPGTIVINSGDMLQMCSNNYYRSTTHRVMNPTGDLAKKSRFSMPLFLHPRDEVQLSETHTARSYLLERLQELGLI